VLTELDAGGGDPRFTTSVHEVLGVVDVRSRRVLPFAEALRRRLVDPATGTYHHPATGRAVPAADAIRHGLIKTRLLVERSDDGCAAWLVPAEGPVLPDQLGTVAIYQPPDQLALTDQLMSPWTSGTPGSGSLLPSFRIRRTISGWLLDLP